MTAAQLWGGEYNSAEEQAATAGGGQDNHVTALRATVGGGAGNTASGILATVGGGAGNTASGLVATIPGGNLNSAQGDYSFAAGRRTQANGDGSFVWGDSTDADITADGADVFLARANGGFWFGAVTANTTVSRTADLVDAGVFISTTTGAQLTAGGAWTNASDRNLKENFAPLDGEEVLAGLTSVPIYTWNYKAEDASVRHLGPTAQDFYAAFGLGADDKHISTVDTDGVALAAIQGLYRVVREKDARIAALEVRMEAQDKRMASQQKQIDELMGRLAAVEATVAQADTTPAGAPFATWPLLGLLFVSMGIVWVNRRRDTW